MADTKNALAELAKDLKSIADWTEGGYGFTAIAKAQRIVAELAKVRTVSCGFPEKLSIPLLDDMANLYAKCRAIAEEGGAK